MTRVTRHTVGALLLMGLAACVAFPLGRQESPLTRQNIGEMVPDFIVPSVTTRADVLLKLGEPDGASENGRQFTYTRGVRVGGYNFVACTIKCIEGTTEKMQYDRLIVSFDYADVVAGARHEQILCDETIPPNVTAPCVNLAGRDLLAANQLGVPEADLFPLAMWYHGVRPNIFQEFPADGTAGSLVVGESSILFYSPDADSKSAPLLTLPYAEIASIDIPRSFLGQASGVLITRTNGTQDTFIIRRVDPRAQVADYKSNAKAGKLAQSRWRAATGR